MMQFQDEKWQTCLKSQFTFETQVFILCQIALVWQKLTGQKYFSIRKYLIKVFVSLHLQELLPYGKKLPVQPLCADVNDGGLSHAVSRASATFTHLAPQDSEKMVIHFEAELLWLLNTSTLQWYHLKLIVEHLGGKKFQKLSHCDRSILLQNHTRIQWVSLNLSQIFVKADSMVRGLILYTCGNEWKHLNSKFKRRNPVLFTIT